MTEVGVKGTFFVIVEKARSLEQRGRTDVIAAMARHDIGSHTNRGSIHPTVTEQLEEAGWEEGVSLMEEDGEVILRNLAAGQRAMLFSGERPQPLFVGLVISREEKQDGRVG